MRSHADIVDEFGGTAGLAAALGLSPKLTTHWRRRGIPAKYWARVEETELARERGITAGRLMRLRVRDLVAA